MKFNKKDRQLLDKVKSKGVVFKMEEKAFRNRIPTNRWCKQLESIAQWPFQYYWFEKGGEMTDNLVLVFHGNPKEGEIDGCLNSLDWTTGLDYWTGLLDS